MKLYVTYTVLLSFILSVLGCGGSDDGETDFGILDFTMRIEGEMNTADPEEHTPIGLDVGGGEIYLTTFIANGISRDDMSSSDERSVSIYLSSTDGISSDAISFFSASCLDYVCNGVQGYPCDFGEESTLQCLDGDAVDISSFLTGQLTEAFLVLNYCSVAGDEELCDTSSIAIQIQQISTSEN